MKEFIKDKLRPYPFWYYSLPIFIIFVLISLITYGMIHISKSVKTTVAKEGFIALMDITLADAQLSDIFTVGLILIVINLLANLMFRN